MKSAIAAASAAALLLCAGAPALAQDAAPATAPAPAMTPTATKAEGVIRTSIEQLRRGTIDTSNMTPQMAQAINGQTAQVQDVLNKLGPVQTVTFLGEQERAEIFRVVFQGGATVWMVHFDEAGKVDGMGFKPEGAEQAPQG